VKKAAEDRERVDVTVLREQGVRVVVGLEPKKWEGRGNLGAYVTPIM